MNHKDLCRSLIYRKTTLQLLLTCILIAADTNVYAQEKEKITDESRQRISLNKGWKFFRYSAAEKVDHLIYDVRPEIKDKRDDVPADAKPTEALAVKNDNNVLKAWIMPTGNDFIKGTGNHYIRPKGSPGQDFPFVQGKFNDQSWKGIDLPHDWAISGPFYEGWDAEVGGGMGRLPSQGVAWYRRKVELSKKDAGKSIFLEIEGAMSYAMVWLNGHLVGGWPYGYSSWQVDLTPYVIPGGDNQLAIRLDNPSNSSRWYPGGGIYRNVWLVKTNPVHVKQWGTFVRCSSVSAASAKIDLDVLVQNNSRTTEDIEVTTEIYQLDHFGKSEKKPVATVKANPGHIKPGISSSFSQSVSISKPKLWGPPPTQKPNLYLAVTNVFCKGIKIDSYQTKFGIRDLCFDADKGLLVNGERILIKGVNQHHDLGALGAAFNVRAAERQLEMLRDMGCNAIRMSHNPPAPELLELTDRMGFLVIDEIFDAWELKKPPLDFHLIFPDWYEQDLRALIRRDRNCPSVIMWSFGNEVGEQYTGEEGAKLAKKLQAIVKEEDLTRSTTVAMNYAKAHMPLPEAVDVISLNYQGEGIRFGPGYEGLKGISTPPSFPAFHKKFPNKLILSSENAAALSSRGEYLFPVAGGNTAPVKDSMGGDPKSRQVSAYELYSVEFGSSADRVFSTLDQHPYVAGGFVWTGWDYLGEPTPYYLSRSSYFGIIDLAGFKKDRYYLYQSQWRPELPMVHILPHWNWPERKGLVTPVHVFTSGDEAELFLNGISLGRKRKGQYEYRLRWDDVKYMPGELKVVAYKDGKKWAEDHIKTTGKAAALRLSADRPKIRADARDLTFITAKVSDEKGLMVPRSKNLIRFTIEGPGEIVATDNGDATNMVSFSARQREAFNGLCLVIVRAQPGQTGTIKLTADAEGLLSATIVIKSLTSK